MTGLVSLRQITLEECQQVRVWRNASDVYPMLRTGYKTEEQQAAFHRDVVCNPSAPHRYYALEVGEKIVVDVTGFGPEIPHTVVPGKFIGIGGLTYFDKVPGAGEISLVLGPEFRGHGLGTASVKALLQEAYGPLGLRSVVGECYAQGNQAFWSRMLQRMVTDGEADAVEFTLRNGTLLWNWKRER